ncbi:Crp/Fnr family transcriptional regulator [Candidatus Halobeggiatoa sp. HSG11]|nr:Crp/Fnr family transcriptional regulator [Candidatus Halobeggiatoa sp. HSG11]
MQPQSDQELRQIYLFAELNEQQLELIKKDIRTIQLDAGEFLFKHEQPSKRFFLLKDGHVKLLRSSLGGDEKVFEVVSPGHTFAEAMMFMPNSTYPVTAQAIGKCSLLSFEGKPFINILRESPDTCFKLMAHMSKRLHMWINEIDQLTLQSATYRLINYLLYQVPDGQNSYKIEFLIPKHVIASRLSIQPETFSRILNSLNKAELIRVDARTIYIDNVDRLHLYSLGNTGINNKK